MFRNKTQGWGSPSCSHVAMHGVWGNTATRSHGLACMPGMRCELLRQDDVLVSFIQPCVGFWLGERI